MFSQLPSSIPKMIFLAKFATKGLSQAVMIASIFSMLGLIFPPLIYVGAATIALITLRKGHRSGLVVLGLTMLAIALLSMMIFQQPSPALSFLFMFWLPIWVIATTLRSSQSLAAAIHVAVIMAAVGVLGAYLVLGDPAVYWRDTFETVLIPFMQEAGFQELDKPEVRAYFIESARFMTGAMATVLIIGLILSLLLARWWQSALFNPDGFSKEFQQLRLHPALLLVWLALFGISLMFSGTISSLAAELALPILVVFLFQGLAVAHGVVNALGGHRAWLMGLYVLMAFAPTRIGLMLGVLGLMDTVVHFRERLARRGK